MNQHRRPLVDALADAERAVEVGVGKRTDVAAALCERGVSVTATDVVDRTVPANVEFIRDDVMDPDLAAYRGADLLYALNCPPELQRPVADLACRVGAACRFTTLGGDPAVVEARPRAVGGETLFVTNAPQRVRNA